MTVERFADGRLRLHPGRVAVVEIANTARRNAIGQDMWRALPVICARLAADAAVRVVILRADPAGRAFSAGADISEFAQVDAAAPVAMRAAYEATFRGTDFAEGRAAFLERRPPRFGDQS